MTVTKTLAPTIKGNVCGQCTFAKSLNPPNTPNRFGVQGRHCHRNPPRVTSFLVQAPNPANPDGPAIQTIIDHSAWPIVGVLEEGCGAFRQKILTVQDAPDVRAALAIERKS